jgi:hypothetical protein
MLLNHPATLLAGDEHPPLIRRPARLLTSVALGAARLAQVVHNPTSYWTYHDSMILVRGSSPWTISGEHIDHPFFEIQHELKEQMAYADLVRILHTKGYQIMPMIATMESVTEDYRTTAIRGHTTLTAGLSPTLTLLWFTLIHEEQPCL